ncbi:MAG TPA: hypothetical protein VHB47_23790 [Thermoanaerobaculia bacterium]|jgi:hypothetical protein|nr:hypothetical protein [Thermoanaerobaculia bacterium]
MRSLIAIILLPAILFQGCATAGARAAGAGQPGAPDPGKLQDINDDLAGEPATIELTSGEVVQQALAVRLGTEVTSWHDASGRERTVPTAEVRRVLRDQRHLIGRGFGYGAAAGVLPGYLVFQGDQCHRSCGGDTFGNEAAFVGGILVVIAGGLIGMLFAAANRHPVVVYAGPAVQPAAPSTSSSIQHCRLAAAAASDVLDCSQLAR